jgi:hypothetical protein
MNLYVVRIEWFSNNLGPYIINWVDSFKLLFIQEKMTLELHFPFDYSQGRYEWKSWTLVYETSMRMNYQSWEFSLGLLVHIWSLQLHTQCTTPHKFAQIHGLIVKVKLRDLVYILLQFLGPPLFGTVSKGDAKIALGII